MDVHYRAKPDPNTHLRSSYRMERGLWGPGMVSIEPGVGSSFAEYRHRFGRLDSCNGGDPRLLFAVCIGC